jgi:lactate dehydrogenase-like 2-hydroxyacid dehydrogenase
MNLIDIRRRCTSGTGALPIRFDVGSSLHCGFCRYEKERERVKPELLVVAAIPPELRERLSANYSLIDERPAPGESRPAIPVAVTTSIAGADVALFESLPDLKLVACNGAGLDRIDLEAAKARGIAVQHTPDAVTEDTADCAIGLMYAVVRRIAEADRFVRSGAWATQRMSPSKRLFSRNLGIVGLGKIGKAMARRAAAIGMRVSYTGPNEKPDVDYAYIPDIVRLAEVVDILALSCPAAPSTLHLVNREVLSALGPEGFLINVSRGSVVEEDALIDALMNRTIAGAGLDVFENEPNIDPRFAALENTVLQPHLAAVTTDARQAMADTLERAIDSYFRSNPL